MAPGGRDRDALAHSGLQTRAGGQGEPTPDNLRIAIGEGLSSWVVEHGETVLANDVTKDPRFMRVLRLKETKAQLSVPISSGGDVTGVLSIEHTETDAFDETDQFTAETLAHTLGVAIKNARVKERLDVLNELMRIAVSSLDVAETFDGVTEQVRELVDHDRLSIDLRPPDDEASELLAFAAAGPGFLERGAAMPLESPPGEVIRTGRAVLRTNFPEDSVYPVEFEFAERHDLRSFTFVPLRSKGRVIGSLNFGSLRPGRYTAKELRTAQQTADYLAVIVEHTLLYEESREVAVLEERNRMAREIHDTLAQGFTGIVLQLEAAEQALEDGALPVALNEHLDRARSTGLMHPIADLPSLGERIRGPVAIQRGTFARVIAGAGSCLHVRPEPSTAAASLDCAADGVLLRTRARSATAGCQSPPPPAWRVGRMPKPSSSPPRGLRSPPTRTATRHFGRERPRDTHGVVAVSSPRWRSTRSQRTRSTRPSGVTSTPTWSVSSTWWSTTRPAPRPRSRSGSTRRRAACEGLTLGSESCVRGHRPKGLPPARPYDRAGHRPFASRRTTSGP